MRFGMCEMGRSLAETAGGESARERTNNGVAVADGGTLSGSTTSVLSISSAALSDSGLYTVSVENGCAPTTSAPGKLTVGATTGVAIGREGTQPRARLIYLGPQPAGGRVTFTLQLSRPGAAALGILGVDGHLVSVTEPRQFPAGDSQITWDGPSSAGDRAPAGVHFVRLVADGVGADSQKVVLIR
jgi:hypothetical protein